MYGDLLPMAERGSLLTTGSGMQSTSGTWSGVVSLTPGRYRPPAL